MGRSATSAWLLAALVLTAGTQPCVFAIDGQQSVPKGFKYPEAPETILYRAPLEVRSLRGSIVGPTGDQLSRVLVERLTPGWKIRLDATFTDDEGRFAFPESSTTMQFLRFSKPGFKTLLAKVRTRRAAREPFLKLELRVSQ